MQAKLRNTNFPERQRFVDFKEKGYLQTPDATAEAIMKAIHESKKEKGFFLKIEDWL